MDWISIKEQQPKAGSRIWAMSALGNTYLGVVKKTKIGYNLKCEDGEMLRNFQKWATYDVIY